MAEMIEEEERWRKVKEGGGRWRKVEAGVRQVEEGVGKVWGRCGEGGGRWRQVEEGVGKVWGRYDVSAVGLSPRPFVIPSRLNYSHMLIVAFNSLSL